MNIADGCIYSYTSIVRLSAIDVSRKYIIIKSYRYNRYGTESVIVYKFSASAKPSKKIRLLPSLQRKRKTGVSVAREDAPEASSASSPQSVL